MYTEKVWEQFGLFLHKVMSIVCQSHKSTALSGSASENAESTKTSSGPAWSGERSFNYFEWTDMIPNHSELRSGERNNYIKRLSVKCKVFKSNHISWYKSESDRNLSNATQNVILSCVLQEEMHVIFNVRDVSTFGIHQYTMVLMQPQHFLFVCFLWKKPES